MIGIEVTRTIDWICALKRVEDIKQSKILTTENTEWTTIIQPHGKWFDLRLKELWRYRDLISLFVRRDFVAKYKQTILGPAWHIIQPLLTTVVFTIIFGKVAKLSTDGLPPFLFYMSGTIIWTYFASAITKSSGTFISNAAIFGKVYFPRMSMPISVVISDIIAFCIQFFCFIGFLIYYKYIGADVNPNIWVLLTPVLLIIMGLLGIGLGIIVSSMTTRYRDLSFLVSFGVQLFMYATPVIYPTSSIPERYQWIVLANPMAPVIETFRYAFLGAGTIDQMHLLYSAVMSVTIFIVGIAIFNRVERTFQDTI